ncbi:hypothetical protein PPROV_000968300 [Pycnococcus provasolii]|uniref:F-box domain-containing protein n=1 Tax=Pycnococcus provasolii TaxID=41880 RepID=A0A830HW10_9CHLO|nr:hypothetical protein PPROV_000968300 [Pycnococcus provasolii]
MESALSPDVLSHVRLPLHSLLAVSETSKALWHLINAPNNDCAIWRPIYRQIFNKKTNHDVLTSPRIQSYRLLCASRMQDAAAWRTRANVARVYEAAATQTSSAATTLVCFALTPSHVPPTAAMSAGNAVHIFEPFKVKYEPCILEGCANSTVGGGCVTALTAVPACGEDDDAHTCCFLAGYASGDVGVHTASSRKHVTATAAFKDKHVGGVTRIVALDGGTSCAAVSCSDNGVLKLFGIEKSKSKKNTFICRRTALATVRAHGRGVSAACDASHGTAPALATADRSGKVKLWDVTSGLRCVSSSRMSTSSTTVHSLCTIEDGLLCAAGSGGAWLLDMRCGPRAAVACVVTRRRMSCAVSHGRSLALGGTCGGAIFDTRMLMSGNASRESAICTLDRSDDDDGQGMLDMHLDSRKLVARVDGTVRAYNPDDGSERALSVSRWDDEATGLGGGLASSVCVRGARCTIGMRDGTSLSVNFLNAEESRHDPASSCDEPLEGRFWQSRRNTTVDVR